MRPTTGVIVGCSVILVLASVLAWLFFSMPASPSHQTTSTIPTISDSSEQDKPELETQKTNFNERVHAFERVFRAFDYTNPKKRQEELKKFMTPEAIDDLVRTEKDSPVLAKLMESRATRTVLVVQVSEGEIEDDLAEATAGIVVKATQQDNPDTRYELLSETHWVLTDGTWLVHEVDPL